MESEPFLGTVCIADDNASEREALMKILEKENYKILTASNGAEALALLRSLPIDVLLTDLKMPGMDGAILMRAGKAIHPEMEVVVMTAYGTVDVAVDMMKGGVFDFLTKPLKRLEVLSAVKNAMEKRALLQKNRELTAEVDRLRGERRLIGNSPLFRQVLELVQQIAPSEATVLISGESGTGKELVAELIHELSPRRNASLIKVNCAAIPESLLESELFGHERGAFTGAIFQRMGRFERAHAGTLFLDEIAELIPALQAKLLRVLQTGEFERVGGVKTLKANVRILAATNRDLKDAMRKGLFREDLFWRLHVIPVVLPSLRERREDIPLLVQHFIQKFSERDKRDVHGIDREALLHLGQYSWPGNVRELENTIERAIVLCKGATISSEDLPVEISQREVLLDMISIPIGTPLAVVEQKIIEGTLQHAGGDKELAAKILGISARTIYRRIVE